LHVASPAAALCRGGHEVRCLDLSVEPWDPDALRWAHAVAVSVPMHTAMRLAMNAARRVRREHPGLPTCFYGLYATVSCELVLSELADRVIAGEYEPGLLAWVDRLAAPGMPPGSEPPVIALQRGTFELPARDLLPPLERYARLAVDGEERLVGYVEASHGCVHRCRHCPVPVVYDGRIRVVQAETVLRDVERLVAMGARHITFGDPDFLNGWRHSVAIVRALHERCPQLTFDCTTKVEHVLEHADVWEEMAAAGCLFVVCALESVNDEVLARLDKGHTTAEAVSAIELLRGHEIETRPSFMPFTPWTTPRDVLEIVDFVAAHDLVANVDAVQYTIRLLVPEGSLLLGRDDLREHLGPYQAERLSYPWRSADPEADRLQGRLSALVEQSAAAQEPTGLTFARIRAAVREATGEAPPTGPGGHRYGIDRREATAHRAVVLLSGAHRGPVRSSHSVMTWSGGSPASAAYRSGKQPTRTPATVPIGSAAPISLGQPALQRALVTEHQQHSVLGGDLPEALAHGIARSQPVGVVVKEEHPDDLDAVRALLQLRKDHPPELVARRVAGGGEHVGDLHPRREGSRKARASFSWLRRSGVLGALGPSARPKGGGRAAGR